MNTLRSTLCATAALFALSTASQATDHATAPVNPPIAPTAEVPAEALEQDQPTRVVRFDDLNLSNSAGAEALYRRIRAAARAVCQMPMSADPFENSAVTRCIDRAINEAVVHVNAPVLTTLRFGSEIRLASE
jgi:UrcA family protein